MRYLRPWNLTENFTKIPNPVLYYRGLSLTARVVWAVMTRLTGGKTFCFPKIETIANELDLNRTTVLAAIQNLVEEGFLERYLLSDSGEG